jgi:hypothetical protein
VKTFKSPSDFRASLEKRLNTLSKSSGEDPQRIRRRVAFDRFLARVFLLDDACKRFLLKGGYAMELRFETARATKDVDLTFLKGKDDPESRIDIEIVELLREASVIDLGDYFEYRISEATRDLTNAPYGGSRYRVESLVDDRLFVRFQLDVGSDILVERAEVIEGQGWLEFAGVNNPNFRMISAEQQIAEKIHAYSMPRGISGNSRVRDLVDLVLLIDSRPLDKGKSLRALSSVFKSRATHDIPLELAPPPDDWAVPFDRLSRECGLNHSISEALQKVLSWFVQVTR